MVNIWSLKFNYEFHLRSKNILEVSQVIRSNEICLFLYTGQIVYKIRLDTTTLNRNFCQQFFDGFIFLQPLRCGQDGCKKKITKSK